MSTSPQPQSDESKNRESSTSGQDRLASLSEKELSSLHMRTLLKLHLTRVRMLTAMIRCGLVLICYMLVGAIFFNKEILKIMKFDLRTMHREGMLVPILLITTIFLLSTIVIARLLYLQFRV